MNVYTFHVEHSYSVVQTYDPSPWNQNLLLHEQKLSGIEKKRTLLQCGEQAYQIHIPFMEKLIED